MNSSPFALVYRPALAALVASSLALALATAACAGSSSNTVVDATEVGDGGATSTPAKPDASPPTTPKAVTPAAACTAYAKARCAKAKDCSEFLFGATWGDTTTCEARLSLGCADKLSEPGVTWKPDGLAACAGALPDTSCEDLALEVLPSECKPTAGTLQATESCAHDEQCATGFCKKGSFGACGSCAEPVKEGGFCSRGTDCAAGMLCASGSCRVPVQEGAACYSSKPCAPGLVCSGGSCQKGAPAGAPCGQTPSSPDPCDRAAGVFCSTLVMECRAANVVSTGGTCNPYADICAAGGTCDGFGGGGECLPPPREGDSCRVSGTGAGCFAPSICDNGKCVVPTAAACAKN